ncbi:MAG: hypothetical protein EBZ77_01425 [Chitinophagia bacterium]|nr:hypothetical protein [Chitinophagia bacterium]
MKKILFFLVAIFTIGVQPLLAQVSCPDNIDFEEGNTSVWYYFTGTCCPSGTIVANTPTAAITNRHTLTSGTGTDPFGGFPVVSPGGGNYSMRLGNSSIGGQAEKARYYVHVPSGVANYALLYRFAAVLEDPTSHSTAQKPRFEVDAYDSATGNAIPCAQYTYVSTSSIPGFVASTRSGATDVYYKGWSTANINLSGTGGTTVTIDFATGDCDLGGHFGYAYIDMSCGLFTISNVACDTGAIALSAPPGFQTYEWYDSATFASVLDTGQNVFLHSGVGHTFAVVLTPFTGYGCPDTLYTHVTPSALSLHPTRDTSICYSSGITLTSGATDILGPLTYAWTSTDPSFSCDTCATPFVSPTMATTYYVTVTNPNGCTKTDSVHVLGNITTVASAHTNVSCFGNHDGTASVNITSNPVPLTYAWSTWPVQTGATAYGLAVGVYTVSVTDTIGCTGYLIDTITGPPARIIAFAGSTGPTTCGGSDGTITISGLDPSSNDTLQFRHNGVTTTVNITASPTGSYTFNGLNRGVYDSFMVITSACPFNMIGPITLNDPALPPAPLPNTNAPICQGDTLRFTNYSAGAGITYSWTGPNGFTSAVQNPSINNVTLPADGTYHISVTRANCVVTDSVYVNVKPAPVPTVGSNGPICAGGTIKLWVNCPTPVDAYHWDGPNLFTSRLQSPSISTRDTLPSGVYTVTLTRLSCATTVTIPYVVNGVPTAPVVQDTGYCQYKPSAPLTATGINLLWFTDSVTGVGSAMAPVPPTNIPGTSTWYVTQTSGAGCVSPFATVKVDISELPTLQFLISDTVACVGSPRTLQPH